MRFGKKVETEIEFGAPHEVWGDKGNRHLGCYYQVFRQKEKDGSTLTTIRATMPEYFLDIVRRFEERMGVIVKDADTPWLDDAAAKRYQSEFDQEGVFGFMAASPLMGGLYGARSARPDLIIPTQRGARRITRWTLYDDRRLLS